ncbi:host cell division inhibitor Icd-like protein [Serratia sp. UGAL515B_01]|nr:host cell division inhibitor Icd-like protein [Serratia sp. UGAL515B_01]
MQRVKATSEKEARRQLASNYVLSFAGVIPGDRRYDNSFLSQA